MTSEEIKETYRMRDILGRYGLPELNRAGFIQCPFHRGDREPSMKIYDKDFHCFGCGATGDIFSFVERMENVGFKEAFRILGGNYEKPTFRSNMVLYRAKKRAAMQQKKRQSLKEELQKCNQLITAYRIGVRLNKPLTDAWCENYNKLQYQLYVREEITKEGEQYGAVGAAYDKKHPGG